MEALGIDYAANPASWTNADLRSFLEAMAAWSQDMEGLYKNTREGLNLISPWRVLADILMGARIYE